MDTDTVDELSKLVETIKTLHDLVMLTNERIDLLEQRLNRTQQAVGS